MRILGLLAILCLAGTSFPALAGGPAITGTWRGTYDCAQGRTGVTLTIDQQSGSDFSGVFHFYAVKENPSVPEGCFTVSGQVAGGGRVQANGTAWIRQPANYVLVDLQGQLTSDVRRLLGVVTTPGYGNLCTGFEVSKISEKPTVAGPCRREAPAISMAY